MEPAEVIAQATHTAVRLVTPWEQTLARLYTGQESDLIHNQDVLRLNVGESIRRLHSTQ